MGSVSAESGNDLSSKKFNEPGTLDDPFALPEVGPYDYRRAQAHAARVDAWLGLEIESTERTLTAVRGQQLWVDLDPQALLTPYMELKEVFEVLKPQGLVVDLGAGYGRAGFVLHRHHPEARFLGYELVPERVREGNRCLHNFGAPPGLVVADLAARDFKPAPAPLYLIYDYGTREAIQKTLADLAEIARAQPVTVVGRGRATRDHIEQRCAWLSQVVRPEHRGNYSIYRSA